MWWPKARNCKISNFNHERRSAFGQRRRPEMAPRGFAGKCVRKSRWKTSNLRARADTPKHTGHPFKSALAVVLKTFFRNALSRCARSRSGTNA